MKRQLESVLFNLAGGVVVLTVVGYISVTEFRGHTVPQCSARMPAGLQYSFENANGQLLSPVEMQGQAGSREWGVLKNTRFVRSASAPLGTALEVTLNPTDNEDRADQNGLGYEWLVAALSHANSACLSYSAFIPADFKFPEPGYLPGLYGGGNPNVLDQDVPDGGFVVRMGWVNGGELGAEVHTPADPFWLGGALSYWPRGRWVSIEQEVKLNTPGKNDGLIRIWVDGQLKIDSHNLQLRPNDQIKLSGVVADIGYSRSKSVPAVLAISPFTLQWQ